MDRRGPLLFLLLCCAASGCASLKTFVDQPAEKPAVVPRMTPAQAYNSGAINAARGDYDAARRDWNRCLAIASPESDARMDCLVALERLATPFATEP